MSEPTATTPTAVLYVSPNGYLGGAEKFIINITRQHRVSGRFAPRILFFNNGPAVDLARENGIDVDVMPFRFRLMRPSLVRAIFYLRRYLKRIAPDIVHLTMPYAHLVMYPACVGLPAKTVWFQHGPVGGLLDQIGNLLGCDLLLFNSKYLQAEHNQMVGAPARFGQKWVPAGVPPPTVDEGHVRSIRASLLGTDRHTLVGMAGRLSPWKGFESFVTAVAKLRSRLSSRDFARCRFVIIGGANRPEDKAYEQELRRLAASAGLEDDLRFLGYVDRVNDYFGALDVFVHASTQPEPFGLIVAEVMLQSTLVVGSCHGGIREILKDGETGYVFDAQAENAAQALSDTLARILPEFRVGDAINARYAALIDNARTLIETEFSVESMSDRIERVYADLLDPRQRNGDEQGG